MISTTDKDALLENQREQIAELQEIVRSIIPRLPPEPEPEFVKGKYYEFPRIVYKAGNKKGQIDHPGNLAKKVRNKAELEAALEAGWSKDLVVLPEKIDPDEEQEPHPEPVKLKGAVKK